MSKQKKYKALIIGAGQIAGGYDDPTSPKILTHAHAYKKHKKTTLLGFYDIDHKCALKSAKKWSCEAFENLDKAICDLSPDIISVCTPDGTHFSVLKQIARYKNAPKLVICEKPITENLSDTDKIIKIYKEKKIPILIDHTRRFDLKVQEVRNNLKKGLYGEVISATVVYGKGILHSGTHIIDLARYFFGEVEDFKVVYSHKDYDSKTDKTIGAFMKFQKCKQFYLVAGDERKYSHFQFDILCEKGRICFGDLGFSVTEQKVIKDPVFEGYKILGKPVVKKTDFDNAVLNMIDNAVENIENGKELVCDAKDARETQQVCLALLKS